jgi:hypothetical protein
MECISSTNFSLINGEPTDFFKSGRGFMQGCPLSPFLFLLVLDILSLALKKGKEDGLVMGIKVSRIIQIIHLLFVDDILIMTKASISEWAEIHRILNSFCTSTGLMINAHKFAFYHHGAQQDVLNSLKTTFYYNFNDLSTRFNYLGYF